MFIKTGQSHDFPESNTSNIVMLHRADVPLFLNVTTFQHHDVFIQCRNITEMVTQLFDKNIFKVRSTPLRF